jgi:tetratricopeptide (TPR) repeat protein
MKHISTKIVLLLIVLAFISCSSAPKKPAEITTLRGLGKAQLELASREIDRANYDDAMILLDDAWNYAVLSDDPELRIKVRLTRGNAVFYQGNDAASQEDWKMALLEAEQDNNKELSAAAKIHIERSRLLQAINSGSSSSSLAEEIKSAVQNEMNAIKNEEMYTALAWTVIGLAEKEQKLWADAENSFKKALQIHEKDNYLEQAAYDWYVIASVRSVSGNYKSAEEALLNAVSFDRRAENSYGLASDWKALADVYIKMGDQEQSQNAQNRSKEIFDSIVLN